MYEFPLKRIQQQVKKQGKKGAEKEYDGNLVFKI